MILSTISLYSFFIVQLFFFVFCFTFSLFVLLSFLLFFSLEWFLIMQGIELLEEYINMSGSDKILHQFQVFFSS